ncbi:uncharacterized protein LOC127857666 [Dreissena polymorpha]|uniref:Cytochrome b5 heme-binding domain-containing protein n=1 Tax=Dreissena polymorpha TaxID=45954 RepID=A0A9D3Z7M2_DREPO|nr:uncharacterized protein LOC127857666 [Dreissena polymorpha]KAH3711719.1 hypothetical protein DPMN_071391 [Dreissena polymorpha]
MSAAMSSLTFLMFTCFGFSCVLCGKYVPVKVKIETHEGGVPPKIFTGEELSKYDASNPEEPIYLAIKGVVFDVTSGRQFYSKGSDYNVLVGKDASRAHALWSLEEKDLTHDLSGLSDKQLQGLDDVYTQTYLPKYTVVGYMDYLIKQQEDDIQKRFTNEEL